MTVKHDITTLNISGLDEVNRFRPVTFIYNSDISPGDQTTHVGFVAEEVNKIDPLLVAFDGAGNIKSVKYQEFVPVLTKAIQELSQKIDDTVLSKSISANPILDTVNARTINVETATISDGLQMKDKVTGQIYCVNISEGEFVKTVGNCQSGTQTSSAPSGSRVSQYVNSPSEPLSSSTSTTSTVLIGPNPANNATTTQTGGNSGTQANLVTTPTPTPGPIETVSTPEPTPSFIANPVSSISASSSSQTQ